MTPITLPRATVEQALEALELGHDTAKAEADRYHVAMAGFRPERHAQMDAEVQQIAAAITALRAELAQQQAEPAEPVAWLYTGIKQDGTEHGPHLVWKPEYMDAMSASKGAKATPLYTAPPQRKLVPLTDEDIERIFMTYHSPRQAARAVERAHGITDPQVADRLARHGIPMPGDPK